MPLANGPRLDTDTQADDYVALRAAGVSAIDAVRLFYTGSTDKLTLDNLRKWARKWEDDPRTLQAWERLNGGKWQDLDDDDRRDIALRHHLAQCAYVLVSTDLADPLVDLKKVSYARTAIVEKLNADKEGSESSKFATFLKTLTDNAGQSLPPIFKAGMPAELLGSTKES